MLATPLATSGPSRHQGLDTAPLTVLQPDAEGDLTDLRIGITAPVLYFAIPIHEDSLVTLRCQELNSASRCALFLSPSDPRPSEETAVWRLTSPLPVKTLVVHPAEDSYTCATTGFLYVAVRYLEGSGSTFFNLSARLQHKFYSLWYHREVRFTADEARVGSHGVDAARRSSLQKGSTSIGAATNRLSLSGPDGPFQASDAVAAPFTGTTHSQDGLVDGSVATVFSSLYLGAWLGRHHHGRGVCFYATAPVEPLDAAAVASDPTRSPSPSLLLLQTMYERRALPWSGLSFPEDPTLDARPLDAAFIAKITVLEDTRAVEGTGGPITTRQRAPSPSGASVCSRDDASASEGSQQEAGDVRDTAPPRSGEHHRRHRRHHDGAEKHPSEMDSWKIIRAPIYEEGLEAYDGEWVMGRKEGHGVYQWRDRAYVGEWKDGQRHGHGELRCANGSFYRGDWRHGRRHGYGEALFAQERTVYSGQWRDGLQEGPGRLRYPNGVVVQGTWTGGVLAAGVEVTATYPDGTAYVGAWADQCRHGQGTSTDARGCRHTHTWAQDKRHGTGSIQLCNGIRFEGVWEGDTLLEGTYWFPNGDAYRGAWDSERDVRSGLGTLHAKNGDCYEGEWSDDARNGQGTMRYASGAVYTGSWAANVPEGQGRLEDAEGVYEGGFSQGLRCGYGEQRGPDGSVYKGQWRHNYRAGHGVQYDATHDTTYTGIFLHDRLQGQGASVKRVRGTAAVARAREEEEAYTGTWLDGKEQGHGTLTLPSGDVMRGVWHRGKQLDGVVQYQAADGALYVGDWYGGERSGHGTQVAADGATVYEGAWLHDKPHGRGRLTHASGESVTCDWYEGHMMDDTPGTVCFLDGSVYVGQVRQGIPHGKGVLTYPDETVFEGSFENGVYNL